MKGPVHPCARRQPRGRRRVRAGQRHAARRISSKDADEYEACPRRARRARAQSALVPIAEARANGFAIDEHEFARPARNSPACTSSTTGSSPICATGIDWTPFFRAWELAGNYPAILDDPVVGESARSLFADAQAMLDKIIAEKWLTARGVAGCGPAGARATMSSCISRKRSAVRLPFLRQQIEKREGRANMCLADFISHDGDWIGGFAVAIHGIEPHLARFKAAMTIIRTSC